MSRSSAKYQTTCKPTECQGKADTFVGTCLRKPTVVRDGKPYCWQHDPERLRARARERFEAVKARDAEQEAIWARWDLERAAGLRPDQIVNLTEDQLREIANMGGLAGLIDLMPTKPPAPSPITEG